jgi:hypothetical protein
MDTALSNTLFHILQRVINAFWLMISGYWQPTNKYVALAKVATPR